MYFIVVFSFVLLSAMTLVGRHRASPIPIVISLSAYIGTRPSVGIKEGPITIVLVLDSSIMMTVIHDHSSATCQKRIGKEERTRIRLKGPPACVRGSHKSEVINGDGAHLSPGRPPRQ
jgi:hypothetical protein